MKVSDAVGETGNVTSVTNAQATEVDDQSCDHESKQDNTNSEVPHRTPVVEAS